MNRHVKKRPFRALFVISGFFLLIACTSEEEISEYIERPVGEIYNTALISLQDGEYKKAAIMFDEVERQHPYSSWATKAQLMSAYSYYQDDSYDSAVVSLDRFIQLHPSSPDVPYAFYLKALSYYEQISDITRDQKMTELAMLTLQELVNRFPTSKYAKDAKLKLDLTHGHLAGKEMEIGRYYLKQGQYLASLNRFRNVINNYQSTTHVPEALHRLTETYVALGITLEAQKVAAVLGHNFPGSEWYVDAYGLVEGKIVKPVEGDLWYRFW